MPNKDFVEFDVTEDMILKGAYWILMKFNADKFHRAMGSAKRDKFGGYLERWMNKIFEKPFFDNFFSQYDKKYKIIYDDLIYQDIKLKTAPDVLGLNFDNKLIQFGKYTNEWTQFENMPSIEIKSFRKDQNVVTTKASQTADYYVFLQHDLDDDYLKTLFSNKFYDEKNYNEILDNWKTLSPLFEENSNIFKEIQKPENSLINSKVELLSIMTGDDWKKYSKLNKGSVKNSSGTIQKQPEKPFYFKEIKEHPPKYKRNPLGQKDLKKINLDFEDKKYLMPVFENENYSDDKLMANITGSSNSTLYFSIEKNFRLNGERFNKGDYKMSFTNFDRTANFDEYCCLKNSVYSYDNREKILEHFDQIVEASK